MLMLSLSFSFLRDTYISTDRVPFKYQQLQEYRPGFTINFTFISNIYSYIICCRNLILLISVPFSYPELYSVDFSNNYPLLIPILHIPVPFTFRRLIAHSTCTVPPYFASFSQSQPSSALLQSLFHRPYPCRSPFFSGGRGSSSHHGGMAITEKFHGTSRAHCSLKQLVPVPATVAWLISLIHFCRRGTLLSFLFFLPHFPFYAAERARVLHRINAPRLAKPTEGTLFRAT